MEEEKLLSEIKRIHSEKADSHAIINTIVAVLGVIFVIGGAWMSINISTAEMKKDILLNREELKKINSYIEQISQNKANHETFKISFEYMLKEIKGQISDLRRERLRGL